MNRLAGGAWLSRLHHPAKVFDLILKGRSDYADIDLAKQLQPDEPLGDETADGVECSEEEHQLNRRTEIKMIK
ncbi:MAG: hypothetical protein ACOX2D_10020 [Fermentimonas sp.]|jgi:hypothetical protein